MNTNSTQFKARLGLFVIIGLALFAIAIFLIGRQKHMFNPVITLSTTFKNVSGLQVGNNVRFSGINVGTVDHITIVNDSTVRVDLIVEKGIQRFIKTDCEASIGSDGIIGNKLVIISQGNSESATVKEGQFIASVEPLEMEAIIANLNETAKNAKVISDQVIDIVAEIKDGNGLLGRLIKDSTIAENINQTISNLKNTSIGLDNNINLLMGNVNVAAKNIVASSEELAQTMKDINRPDGTVGKLLKDTVMAQEIEQTIVNIRTSTKGISETMEAINNSFLFRGYFRKKAEHERQEKIDSILTNRRIISDGK